MLHQLYALVRIGNTEGYKNDKASIVKKRSSSCIPSILDKPNPTKDFGGKGEQISKKIVLPFYRGLRGVNPRRLKKC